MNGKLLVVVAFTERALSFVLLLPAVAAATLVAVPGVTGLLLNDGDTKSAFVLFIFMEIFVVPLVVEFCIFRSYIVSLEIGIVVPFYFYNYRRMNHLQKLFYGLLSIKLAVIERSTAKKN